MKMHIDEKFRRLFPKTKPSKLLTRAFGMRDAASSGSWKLEMRRIVCGASVVFHSAILEPCPRGNVPVSSKNGPMSSTMALSSDALL